MSVAGNKHPKRIFAYVLLNETSIKFQLDSGATGNVLPLQLYRDIFSDPMLLYLERTQTTLVMFNKSKMKVRGKFRTMTINMTATLMTVNAENILSIQSPSEGNPVSIRRRSESFRIHSQLVPKPARRYPEVGPNPKSVQGLMSSVCTKTCSWARDGLKRSCILIKLIKKFHLLKYLFERYQLPLENQLNKRSIDLLNWTS